MDQWYYAWKGEKLGPVPLEEMQRLVEDGALERGDLVWTSGMKDWQPAGSVEALDFPEEPPPLPESQAFHRVIDGRFDEVWPVLTRKLWQRKPLFFLVGFLAFGILAGIFATADLPKPFLVAALIPAIVCLAGFALTGLYEVCGSITVWQRKTWLRQKWESTSKNGGWIQFSEDGGFVKSDGFGAKYTFDPKEDRIELRPVDGSDPVQLQVVLLSEKELAITWDGQTLHYQKPSWWKRMLG